jgi:hypothetical protein
MHSDMDSDTGSGQAALDAEPYGEGATAREVQRSTVLLRALTAMPVRGHAIAQID